MVAGLVINEDWTRETEEFKKIVALIVEQFLELIDKVSYTGSPNTGRGFRVEAGNLDEVDQIVACIMKEVTFPKVFSGPWKYSYELRPTKVE